MYKKILVPYDKSDPAKNALGAALDLAAGVPGAQITVLSVVDWHDFNAEYKLFSSKYERTPDTSCGDDTAIMFFTSGTTGNPKMAAHKHTYALGHFVTAKYWHCCERDGLHLTISDTGWGKSLWGKLYGQWLCEGAVFTYDFDRFDASKILPMFAKYHITTFCAPPTMYRMLIKQDLSQYDLSSIQHATTAGEALNPEVFYQFRKATGLQIAEGYGQTEMTLGSGNLTGARVVSGGTALVYNAAGEVYSREVTTGELTTYYNAAGRVTGTSRKAGNSTVFRNTAGYMTGTITEAPGRTTWYDDMGIVTGTARTEALCRKFYEGKLVAVDNPAELHERRKQEVAMNVQTAQARRNEAGRKTVRHYDVNGRLIATTESGGGTIRRYGATGEHMGTTAAGSR